MEGNRVGRIEGDGSSIDLGLLLVDDVLDLLVVLVGYFVGVSYSLSSWSKCKGGHYDDALVYRVCESTSARSSVK